ncbi:MAG: phage major capsid protein [Pseudomonadota bacterium]
MRMTETELRDYVAKRVKENVAKAAKGDGNGPRLFAPKKSTTANKRDPESITGALLRLKYQAKNADTANPQAWAREKAIEVYGENSRVVKNMTAGDANQGKEMVPTIVSEEILEALANRTIMRKNGAVVIDNPSGSMTIPKLTSVVQGTWVGEGVASTNQATSPGTDQVSLTDKKMMITVPVSKDLLISAAGNIEQAIMNNVLTGAATTEDAAFLRAVGSATIPTGIFNQLAAANVSASAGTTSENIEADLGQLKQALLGANVNVTEEGSIYILSTREAERLERLRDDNGNLIFPELKMNGKIGRYKAATTNAIPTNLGGGSNESEVAFLNMPDVLIADHGVAQAEVLENVTYRDSGGTLRTTVDTDEAVVRMILRTDIALQYDVAGALKTGVTWGV